MTFSIPTHKCGLVIGRGGENVKAINQQTGAFVEISRQLPPNGDPNFKLFIIRGSPQQIDHAKQLIEEKIEVGSGRGSGSLGSAAGAHPLTSTFLPPGSPLPSRTRPWGTRSCRPHGALQPRTLQSGATRGSSSCRGPPSSPVPTPGLGQYVPPVATTCSS